MSFLILKLFCLLCNHGQKMLLQSEIDLFPKIFSEKK